MAGSNSLESGFAALDAGRYAQARAAFEKALAIEASAAGYDGLAQALRWMGEGAASLAARETAYRLYREGGDAARAGLTTGWLAWDALLLRGDWAVAQGWFARAGRWGDCRAELADLFHSQHRSTDDAGVRIEAEYMLIIARPR